MLATKLRSATAGREGWDLANAVYNGTPNNKFFVGEQEGSARDIFFKPDGLNMYIIGNSGQEVNQYTLSTAWDISTATFLQLFSVLAQETSPQGLFFRDNGLSMYVIGSSGDDVNQYTLSTAWDISTATFLQLFSIAAQETAPQGLSFSSDGLSMYVIGSSGDDVNQYTLSTAWDISTATFLQNFFVSTQEISPQGLFFKSDGLTMYITGAGSDSVHQYTLSTAWNISTATFLQSFSVAGLETAPTGLFFKPDGLSMYIIGSNTNSIYAYDLSTAWDISTAVFNNPTTNYFSVVGQEFFPQGIFFKPDGLSMYIIGSSGDNVNQYTLSTAWDIATASYLQNFSVSAQETVPTGLFFKPDGLEMYIIGSSGDDVNQYTLSTAWDISTATFLQNFFVSTQEISPQGLFFKSDGLTMYITGAGSDSVHQYTLSTAWNISTATFLQSFSVAGLETAPTGLFFKPDGLSMYIIGLSGDDVNQFTLSTAWDISTATFTRLFSVENQEINPTDVFFKPDGLKMYITSQESSVVYSYDL